MEKKHVSPNYPSGFLHDWSRNPMILSVDQSSFRSLRPRIFGETKYLPTNHGTPNANARSGGGMLAIFIKWSNWSFISSLFGFLRTPEIKAHENT